MNFSDILSGAGLLSDFFGGGTKTNGGAGTQTSERTPWAPAQPYIMRGLQDTSTLNDYYQKKPFSDLQNKYYGQQFADLDNFRNTVAPGLMSFANSGMTGGYQRGGSTIPQRGAFSTGQTGGGGQSQSSIGGDIASIFSRPAAQQQQASGGGGNAAAAAAMGGAGGSVFDLFKNAGGNTDGTRTGGGQGISTGMQDFGFGLMSEADNPFFKFISPTLSSIAGGVGGNIIDNQIDGISQAHNLMASNTPAESGLLAVTDANGNIRLVSTADSIAAQNAAMFGDSIGNGSSTSASSVNYTRNPATYASYGDTGDGD